ncbi:MAG: helix-turn-helix transcriptional regulator, partial [Phyllobacteriaceae bacterium]|nr:helix-turn-helix transcriptional regulator [Phyllobacteriaceae bacterium]
MPERKLTLRQLEKHQRILTAALKVFAESGYSAASMDAIAIAAEVSKPTLYT